MIKSSLVHAATVAAVLALVATSVEAGRFSRNAQGARLAQGSVASASRRAAPAPRAQPATRGTPGAGVSNRAVPATGAVNTGNVNRGVSNRGTVNTGNVNTGNVSNRQAVNNGNINIGNDVDIDIDVDGSHHGDWDHNGDWDHVHHPIAAGITISAIAVTTAAVIGSYYYALPAGCTTIIREGETIWVCGSAYYRRVWYGNDIVYVVIAP